MAIELVKRTWSILSVLLFGAMKVLFYSLKLGSALKVPVLITAGLPSLNVRSDD